MKLTSLIATAVGLSLIASVSPVFAALPTVNTFTVAATAVSSVPVTAFTASDSDGTVVGYMITQTSTKPAASDSRWTGTPWTQFTTTSIGALTLYAWAKDNANGVSNSRSATTNVVGGHVHTMAQVTGLSTALAGKADVSHNHDSMYQKKYANVIVVAKSGGDFTDPVAAVNSITNASVTNPYLVKVMPGVYETSGTVVVPSFVDFQGSGQGTTTIINSTTALVLDLGNSELRNVTIENVNSVSTSSCTAIGLYADGAKITKVTAKATDSFASCTPIGIGNFLVRTGEYQVTMTDVNVSVTVTGSGNGGFGMYLETSPADQPTILNNVDISISGGQAVSGIISTYGTLVVKNSKIRAQAWSQGFGIEGHNLQIMNSDLQGSSLGLNPHGDSTIVNSKISSLSGTGNVKLSFSELSSVPYASGVLTCYNVHDSNFVGITCP